VRQQSLKAVSGQNAGWLPCVCRTQQIPQHAHCPAPKKEKSEISARPSCAVDLSQEVNYRPRPWTRSIFLASTHQISPAILAGPLMQFSFPNTRLLRLGLLSAVLALGAGCAVCPGPPILRPVLCWSPFRFHPCVRPGESGALFGHHGTCWSPWPPGWVPCPSQDCAPPLVVSEPIAPPAMLEELGLPQAPPQEQETLPDPPPAPDPGIAPSETDTTHTFVPYAPSPGAPFAPPQPAEGALRRIPPLELLTRDRAF
jgi:hypothetical protein